MNRIEEKMDRTTQSASQNVVDATNERGVMEDPAAHDGNACQGKSRAPDGSLHTHCSGECKEMVNKDYPESFFSTLTRLREDGLLVDLSVSVSGTLYDAHCFVLAAVSKFFYSVIEQKNTQYTVNLESKVPLRGWEAILDFAYHGTLHLHKDTAEEICLAADALQVPRVLDACKKFQTPPPLRTPSGGMSVSEEKCETFQAIQDLYRKGIGCDLHLQANYRSFSVHRAALAAGSDFFHGMFTSGMVEAQKETIDLKTISSEDLHLFIDFIYSGKLQVSWDNVFDIFEAALQYQMEGILVLCFRFFHEEMCPEWSLDVMALSDAYKLHDLKCFTETFILRNFKEVVALPKYLDLTAEQLLSFLSNDALYTTTEIEVFHAVHQWINADRAERLCQASNVMQCVRFPLLTNRELRQVLAVDLMAPSAKCYAVLEASLLSVPRGPSVISQLPCRIRILENVLVIIGGDSLDENLSNRTPNKEMWFAHRFISGIGFIKYIEWRPLNCLPEVPRFRHGVVVLGNAIYVFGGNFYYGKQDVLKTAIRYDPMKDTWENLANMKESHSYFPLVCLDGLIYILGGNSDVSNIDCLDSVEVYNPANNTWKYVHPLPQPLCGHAAAVCDGRIYISGGCDNTYQCLNSLFLYHPVSGATYLSPMDDVRAGHVMETIRGKVYVAGGLGQGVRGYEDQYMCEVYNPSTDSWAQLAPLKQAHVVAASAVLQEELYLLGGYSYETYRDTHLVHCYSPKTDRWVSLGTMPNSFADIKACVVSVPAHRRQKQVDQPATTT